MITKITIKNYKGIKERLTLDFQLNHLKPSQLEKENTFITKDGIKAMAVPSLIAKNASGKTSILDAIRFADTINSLEDATKWVTKDLDKLQGDIERTFKTSLIRLQRFVTEDTKISEVKDIVFTSMNSIARDLKFDPIFDRDINSEGISADYLRYGMQKLEENVFNRAQGIVSHIKSDLLDPVTKEVKETEVRIDYSNKDFKHIVIGKTISFNGQSESLDNILKKATDNYEDTTFISDSYANFNGYFLYVTDNFPYEDIKLTKIEQANREKYSSLRESVSVAKAKTELINDQLIRAKISTNASVRDWGGEALINNFVTNYGPVLATNIIHSIDSSIHHIEGSKEKGLWILKEETGVVRSVSDLSFGTFKTIYILNAIYSSWKNDKTLLIDEIENGLNISLIELIIRFATNEKFAKDGFQMLITTHNPLIFDQKVINPQNAFINISGKFERVIDNKELISRSEDLDKVFASKNYFNEFYWLKSFKEPGKSSHTIIKDDIFDLLDEIEESPL